MTTKFPEREYGSETVAGLGRLLDLDPSIRIVVLDSMLNEAKLSDRVIGMLIQDLEDKSDLTEDDEVLVREKIIAVLENFHEVARPLVLERWRTARNPVIASAMAQVFARVGLHNLSGKEMIALKQAAEQGCAEAKQLLV
jgi:AcrR family transcriptional regulator